MFPPSSDSDVPVRLTDNDAAIARLSAVQKGYLDDPFAAAFVPRAHLQPARPPLINMGTYVRTTAIESLVEQWLELAHNDGMQGQIISLGAGSDSRFWRLESGKHAGDLAKYIEFDFPEITTKKAMTIRKSKVLSSVLGDPNKIQVSSGGTGLDSPKYHLIPADLRQPPDETYGPLFCKEIDPILSVSRPTLLLFECVLAYMAPESSNRLLTWFREQFSFGILGAVVYEMFGLDDSFGRVMVNNLKLRNVELPGVQPYSTEASLPSRFLNLEFTAARALTLRNIRLQYLQPKELARISKLEFLDEIEEMDLVLQHYAVTWGLCLPQEKYQSAWGTWGLQKQGAIQRD